MRNNIPPTPRSKDTSSVEITLHQDPEYRRFGSTIDFNAALLKYNTFR